MSIVRDTTITATTQMVTEECCNCGVLFAIPSEMRRRLIESQDRFYCPNGHGQSYTGKTEAQKEREAREKAERGAAYLRSQLDQERAALTDTKNKLRAEKAAKTRARNRAARGQCPAQGCRRPFANVAEHVRDCHPELAELADRVE